MPAEESRDPAYLWDMLDAASALSTFVDGRTFGEYQADRMLRNAVERNIEIIGEAGGEGDALKILSCATFMCLRIRLQILNILRASPSYPLQKNSR